MMAVTAGNIDSTWVLSFTNDSEFDKYTESPAKQNKKNSNVLRPKFIEIRTALLRFTTGVLRTSSRVALLGFDLASCLRVKLYWTTFKVVVGAILETRGLCLNTHNFVTISHINLILSRYIELPFPCILV